VPSVGAVGSVPFTPDPVAVRRAATVMILRGGADALEILMLRRSPTASFVADALVFPGGAHDDGDGHGMDGLARTAAREAFEEAGILLARHPSRSVSRAASAQLLEHRRAVHAGEMAFDVLLGSADLSVDLASLWPWARWVTPAGAVRRFDTQFFVTRCPEDQEASADQQETVEHRWATPHELLDDAAHGRVLLIGPTRRSLIALSRFTSADAVLDTMGRSANWSVPAVLPAVNQ
jgi:recombination protein RecT